MASLTGTKVSDTYQQLLKLTSQGVGADASAKYIEDGLGTDTALSLSTTRVGIGTDSPGYQLDLRRNDTGTTTSLGIRQLGTGDASMAFQTTTSPYGFCIGVDGSDSDAFKFATGTDDVGTNTKLTITTSGNVGINATPQSTVGKVDIAGSAANFNTAPMITFRDTAGNANSRNWSIGGLAVNYGDFHIGVGDTNSDYFDASSHSKFTINKDGNIGVGTTSPYSLSNYKFLSVSASTGGGLVCMDDGTVKGGVYNAVNDMYYDTTTNHIFRTGASGALSGTERMRIASDGDVTLTGNNITVDPPSGDASLVLSHSSQTLRIDQNSIRTTTNSAINIFTNDTGGQGIYIASDGDVGVNQTLPDAKLHIKGVAKIVNIESTSATGRCYIMFEDPSSDKGFIGYGSSQNDVLAVYNYKNNGLQFGAGGAEVMSIDTSGNVTPTGSLYLAGGSTGRILFNSQKAIEGTTNNTLLNLGEDYLDVRVRANCIPDGNNTRNLGSTSYRWSVLYTSNAVNVSDRTTKTEIADCDLGTDFINTLQPKSYKMADLPEEHDDYDRKHYGLIAQDLIDTELNDSVFGEQDGEYSLAYNDLIAPMIKAIQELSAQNDALTARLDDLEPEEPEQEQSPTVKERVNSLEARVNALENG